MIMTNSPVFAVGMMLAGLAAGTAWYAARLRKEGLPVRAALLSAAIGSLLALVCAKVCFLLHDLGSNLMEGYYDEVLSLDPAALSFTGGCFGFVAGTALSARLCHVRTAKALDLFAAPGCLFLFFARAAEAGMDSVGMGNEVTADWLKFFPLTMQNNWGDHYLCVFFLEAVTALVCLTQALRTYPGAPEGTVMRRTAVCLLSVQICWEMFLQYPYIRAFVTSFVSLEQVLCGAALLALMIAGCIRNGKWWAVAAAAALLGVSAFFQFMRDNKIEFMFEEGWEWLLDNAQPVSLAAFVLVSAGLMFAGLKAVTADAGSGRRNCNGKSPE